MLKKNKKRLLWKKLALFKFATNWVNKLRRKKGAVSEYSPWWVFVYDWRILIEFWLNDFLAGNYRFSPMIIHHISGETSITWSYKDRLIVKWIHKIITPVFKHIVSPLCFHLSGASGVKKAVKRIKTVLESKHFRYFIRADIKSYYASIDRNILVTQIQQYFNDPRLLKYLTDIIHIPIVDGGVVFTHETGLPRRSSLSPFFGAIYLSPLDQIFERSKGIFYIRYMDDIVILTETKRQYLNAKRKLKNILSKLKLSLSRPKTKMGKLESGFHFLGVNFAAPQSQQGKNHLTTVSIHDRSCRRALDKMNATGEGTVNPVKAQIYLSNWAKWWSRTLYPFSNYIVCVKRWVLLTQEGPFAPLASIGSGLLVS